MNESFEPSEDEDLKNENEFLKMKLMLEHGAYFGAGNMDTQLPAGMENQFLNYVAAFEKQEAERKVIRVFDKIQRPDHFKPVNQIPVDEIDKAWHELGIYLNKYDIDLAVCSPNITNRELYRFAVEELFKEEMNDINIPGMKTCYTYDEFYPDYKYDNTNQAVDDCIKIIFKKQHLDWMPMLKGKNLRINDHYPLSDKEFLHLINNFKAAYEDIQLAEMKEPACFIEGKSCFVKGNYKVKLILQQETICLSGCWTVEFEFDDTFWEILNVQIDGINF